MTKINIRSNWLWPSQTWLWPLVVLILGLGAFYLKPWQTKPTETISVSAEGKAQATPNVATITATLISENPNLENARKENEKKVTEIITTLKQLGVDEKDIQTQNISGGPGYEILPQTQIYPRPPQPSTNQFSTSFEITIRNFENSDEIIAAVTKVGATNLYGPNLTLDQEAQEATKSQARQKAIEAARQKAQQLADLSERKLGKVTNIKEEGDIRFPEPIVAYSELDLREKATSIMPGQNEVSVAIKVEFELK